MGVSSASERQISASARQMIAEYISSLEEPPNKAEEMAPSKHRTVEYRAGGGGRGLRESCQSLHPPLPTVTVLAWRVALVSSVVLSC